MKTFRELRDLITETLALVRKARAALEMWSTPQRYVTFDKPSTSPDADAVRAAVTKLWQEASQLVTDHHL